MTSKDPKELDKMDIPELLKRMQEVLDKSKETLKTLEHIEKVLTDEVPETKI